VADVGEMKVRTRDEDVFPPHLDLRYSHHPSHRSGVVWFLSFFFFSRHGLWFDYMVRTARSLYILYMWRDGGEKCCCCPLVSGYGVARNDGDLLWTPLPPSSSEPKSSWFICSWSRHHLSRTATGTRSTNLPAPRWGRVKVLVQISGRVQPEQRSS
jgi:hypothetical protein